LTTTKLMQRGFVNSSKNLSLYERRRNGTQNYNKIRYDKSSKNNESKTNYNYGNNSFKYKYNNKRKNDNIKTRGTPVDEYILKEGNCFIKAFEDIRKETEKRFPRQSIMQVDYDQCYLFKWLMPVLNVTNAIEIGVFTGSSSLAIALGLPKNGTLIAIDVNAQFTSIAQKYWKKCGVNDKIKLSLHGGINTLNKMLTNKIELKRYDFAFIDGVKREYIQYYERLLKLIKPGGIIAFDNVLRKGYVTDPKTYDKSAQYMRQLNEYICNDKRVSHCMISISDGMTFCRVLI